MRSNSARVVSICLGLMTAILATPNDAQAGTTGFISGCVRDTSTGAGIPNALITVDAPSATVTVRTDKDGRYSALSLPPDAYVVTARRADYETTTMTDVVVTSDQTIVVNLKTGKK